MNMPFFERLKLKFLPVVSDKDETSQVEYVNVGEVSQTYEYAIVKKPKTKRS